jgi:hypothetical protein
VRLTVTGGNVEELDLDASDLEDRTNPDKRIDRSNITIPAGTDLDENQPRDVPVTVSNVTRPGSYSGDLEFLLPGQTEAKALRIPLEMQISPTPEVKPFVEDSSFQLARSAAIGGNPVADVLRFFVAWMQPLADWSLPHGMADNTKDVRFDNQTPATVRVADVDLVMQGSRTGEVVRSNDIKLEWPEELPASEVVPVSLTIDRSSLSPDRYEGTIRLKLDGVDDPVTANLALDVRDGPLLPLLIIFIGVVFGRFVSSMTSPIAQMQNRLLQRYYQLRGRISNLLPEWVRSHLSEQLGNVLRRITSATATEQILSQELDKLDKDVDFLRRLEIVENEANALGLRDVIENEISQARRALLANDVDRAEAQYRAAWDKVRNAAGQMQTSRAVAQAGNVVVAVPIESYLASEAPPVELQRQAPDAQHVSRLISWPAHTLAWLAGTRVISLTEIRYWLVRPLLFIALLILLTLLGWQTLYINNGTNFGVGGLLDYLGLFLWGLSADIAQRTLQNLPR